MTRPQRSVEDRRAGLTHVGYEVLLCAMGPWMHTHLAGQLPADRGQAASNALVESQLTHTRIAVEFFLRWPKRGSENDMLRTDFLEPDWTPGPSAPVGRLNSLWGDLNKHLSHLSWKRIKGERLWPLAQIALDVVDVADAWSQQLPADLSDVLPEYLIVARAAAPVPGVEMLEMTTSSRGATGPALTFGSPGMSVG